jgi:reactive intermediate/imine deaminase
MRKILTSPAVAPTAKFFSQGVRAGSTIYVSGQVGMDRNGTIVGKGDMKAHARQAIENIRAVLAEAGATLDDVVKVTMYVTDMSRADQAREVRMEYFTKNPPASTGLEVKGLAHPDLLIEIEAIAVVGE